MFKRILVRTDTERSLLSLIGRVSDNLLGVELVTSPEGDHAANRNDEVGVREIIAQRSILRSQVEQGLGNRMDKHYPRTSWIPRHAANGVSKYRLEDVARLADAQWWNLASHCISDMLSTTTQCEVETRGCCVVSTWAITRGQVPHILLHARWFEARN